MAWSVRLHADVLKLRLTPKCHGAALATGYVEESLRRTAIAPFLAAPF